MGEKRASLRSARGLVCVCTGAPQGKPLLWLANYSVIKRTLPVRDREATLWRQVEVNRGIKEVLVTVSPANTLTSSIHMLAKPLSESSTDPK